MIERLTGEVAAKGADGVVLDVGGVGFLVDVSGVTLRDVPDVGQKTSLFTHLHVREDVMQLFGFATEEERALFRLLLSVSKIGPRLALAALSCRRAPDLKRALATGDIAVFASVPGIGRKTAERIILELREKIAEGMVGAQEAGEATEDASDPLLLARSGLVELGYSVSEAEKLLSTLDPGLPAEELVRLALGRSS